MGIKDANDVVLNCNEVGGALTKNGSLFVLNGVAQPTRYITGEEWVLGKNVIDTLDPAKLKKGGPAATTTIFINAWYSALKNTRFVAYKDWEGCGR